MIVHVTGAIAWDSGRYVGVFVIGPNGQPENAYVDPNVETAEEAAVELAEAAIEAARFRHPDYSKIIYYVESPGFTDRLKDIGGSAAARLRMLYVDSLTDSRALEFPPTAKRTKAYTYCVRAAHELIRGEPITPRLIVKADSQEVAAKIKQMEKVASEPLPFDLATEAQCISSVLFAPTPDARKFIAMASREDFYDDFNGWMWAELSDVVPAVDLWDEQAWAIFLRHLLTAAFKRGDREAILNGFEFGNRKDTKRSWMDKLWWNGVYSLDVLVELSQQRRRIIAATSELATALQPGCVNAPPVV